ncbi:hypothetical protein TELCIR_23479, partial [Teladorsagia circumcincta]
MFESGKASISQIEYVADPFLMKDQLKFDFRVYGVIKSINPLSIYVSREGMFCKFIQFRRHVAIQGCW